MLMHGLVLSILLVSYICFQTVFKKIENVCEFSNGVDYARSTQYIKPNKLYRNGGK